MKKTAIKTPPRGGDAAAAWDHNLKPDEKEELIRQNRELGERKLMQGKRAVLAIAVINALLAVISSFTGFDLILLCVRLLMCIALFLGAPGIKFLFTAGAFASVIMILGAWNNAAEPGTFKMIVHITESALLIVSAIILLADERISEYLYMKRNG